eukprot:TRINITY_DN26374_c0_g1_i1.p1 TRINITY_DN26374_c0_g1~~TRINITY_DN26374_c0_g1_i1.p1  ORF type:complete len:595 (-),score=44.01 TRINITY_DN26374_c0_g1_i1:186-1724(-)
MSECQHALEKSTDTCFQSKVKARFWKAASRVLLATLTAECLRVVYAWIAKHMVQVTSLLPVGFQFAYDIHATDVDLQMLCVCTKLKDVASKHNLFDENKSPGVITLLPEDPLLCALLVPLLVMVGFSPTTLLCDQQPGDFTSGQTFPLLSCFVDEITRWKEFHSLQNPELVAPHIFVQRWLEHHRPPLDMKHFDGLSPVDTVLINITGSDGDVEIIERSRKCKKRGMRDVSLCFHGLLHGQQCIECTRREFECIPTKRNLKASKEEILRFHALLESLCTYGYRSTLEYKPSLARYVGGTEACIRVEVNDQRDLVISKATWKLYEDVLAALGTTSSRKLCQVCGQPGGLACAGCPKDGAPYYCSVGCQKQHWELSHKRSCALANGLQVKCVLCHRDETTYSWLDENESPFLIASQATVPPDGAMPRQLPPLQTAIFIVRIDIPLSSTPSEEPPLFICNKQRSVNCFVDPESAAYLPLVQLALKEGRLKSRVYVSAKTTRHGAIKVGTSASSGW